MALFLERKHILKHQRGLLFQRGDFRELLQPGTHWLPGNLVNFRKVLAYGVNMLDTEFDHPWLRVLVKHPVLADALHVVDLRDAQRALVWRDGRLFQILGPGLYAFWKEPYDVQIEVFDVDGFRFEHKQLEVVLAHPGYGEFLGTVTVNPYAEVLVYRDNELVTRLLHGRYAYWKQTGRIVTREIDRREQTLDVAGQEIMTRDKVTLRMNLVVTYRIDDPVKAVEATTDAAQALYRDAQLALRAAVGTRPLDGLLTDKEAVGSTVREALAARAATFGVTVLSVGLRDIVLPGDMKTILNQVITAQKEAEANLIRRREETAAARSQANTAKLLAENPILARMKELELLQEVLAGAKTSFVFGQGDLIKQVRSLVQDAEGTE